MRLTGFTWFGVLIAKIFIYDLRELGSVARALSFLAVGGLLLAGAFVYQHLTREFEERDAQDPEPPKAKPRPTPGSAN